MELLDDPTSTWQTIPYDFVINLLSIIFGLLSGRRHIYFFIFF
jgi:hypothetical protein